MKIEFCIESLEEYQLAKNYNADRVELCSALDLGGLTPSSGLTKLCCLNRGPEVHVMIRPRPGDFAYSSDEINVMKEDIIIAAKNGANGVVFGVSTHKHELDLKQMAILAKLSKQYELEITCHRVFDLVLDPFLSLQQLVSLGFNRVLTSGTAMTAQEGLPILKDLLKMSKGNIEIQAGSGVNSDNINLFKEAKLDGAHFVSHKKLEEFSKFCFGKNREIDTLKVELIYKKLKLG